MIKGKIHIESRRLDEDGQEEKSSSVAEASQVRDGGALILSYQEPAENQMEETMTSLRYEGDRLELIRQGYVTMAVCFSCDEISQCRYGTQGLGMDLLVKTSKLELIKKDGWIESIDLAYGLEMEDGLTSQHVLKLQYIK